MRTKEKWKQKKVKTIIFNDVYRKPIFQIHAKVACMHVHILNKEHVYFSKKKLRGEEEN